MTKRRGSPLPCCCSPAEQQIGLGMPWAGASLFDLKNTAYLHERGGGGGGGGGGVKGKEIRPKRSNMWISQGTPERQPFPVKVQSSSVLDGLPFTVSVEGSLCRTPSYTPVGLRPGGRWGCGLWECRSIQSWTNPHAMVGADQHKPLFIHLGDTFTA